MKKRFCIIIVCICFGILCACSNLKHIEELEKWDCTVTCAEESDNTYVITYSNEKIISNMQILPGSDAAICPIPDCRVSRFPRKSAAAAAPSSRRHRTFF